MIAPAGESEPQLEVTADPQPDPDAWRREVAARLARYRTRRKPRAPRYPSLLLPFDAANDRPRNFIASHSSQPSASSDLSVDRFSIEDTNAAADIFAPANNQNAPSNDARDGRFAVSVQPHPSEPEPSAKVIEFPRSAAIPIIESDLLADPILDRPRIVEAPEIVPPAPALGGILIGPLQPEPVDRSANTPTRIPQASIGHRLLAVFLDSLIIAAAISAFSAIFLRFNPVHVSLSILAGAAGALAILLWMTYQFFFIVCTGSTPGLRAARLRLMRFDGSPVPRRVRRWRVLASFLSAFSAGLGYLWCFLDQDSLCWHDRITRTYLESARVADAH